MWEYNETNNYYYCLLDKHRLVVQPLTYSYCIWLYVGKEQLVAIKAYINADSVEEAQDEAMKLVRNHAIRKACFWNNLVYATDNSLLK